MEGSRRLEAQLEAILFTMGESVELARLAAAVGQEENTVYQALQRMMGQYEDEGRGIQIIELDGSFQLCTKKEFYETLVQVAHIPKRHVLTEVLLETLSIIAYKQPVTKQEIEAIRGVKCDHAVNKLVEYGLVCEVGRLDVPGRPIVFGTTEDFLRSFGIGSLEDLPVLAPEKAEGFKQEAEAEAEKVWGQPNG